MALTALIAVFTLLRVINLSTNTSANTTLSLGVTFNVRIIIHLIKNMIYFILTLFAFSLVLW